MNNNIIFNVALFCSIFILLIVFIGCIFKLHNIYVAFFKHKHLMKKYEKFKKKYPDVFQAKEYYWRIKSKRNFYIAKKIEPLKNSEKILREFLPKSTMQERDEINERIESIKIEIKELENAIPYTSLQLQEAYFAAKNITKDKKIIRFLKKMEQFYEKEGYIDV